jgi:predicted DNA binding CopG/RHH family protein
MKKLKKIPKFTVPDGRQESEERERKFWAKHDSTDYIDWSKAKETRFPNLKPSTKTISLRLPTSLLKEIKIQANKKDIPYQSYMKVILTKEVFGR